MVTTTVRHAGIRKAAPHWAERWERPVMFGLAAVLFVMAALELATLVRSGWAGVYAFGNGDLVGYLEGARRFLETGSPYAPEQVSGAHWGLMPHSFIHPPSALFLFVPFLVLPAILWWAIPIIGTAILVYRWRPAPWTWPLIALAFVWPRTLGVILTGNSDLWVTFAVALGCRYGWGFALLIVKPTFAPLGLVGLRRRAYWLGVGAVGLLSLPLVALWFQYPTVIRTTDLDPTYSLMNLPLILVPVVAWAGRSES